MWDTARVPYGSRDRAEIRSIAAEVVGWLREQGAEAVVMACNTTNALALDVAQSEAGVPVLGLIDSVARQVQQQRIGVLATEATAASGAYGRALQAQRQGLTVVEMGCPAFVPLWRPISSIHRNCGRQHCAISSHFWRPALRRSSWAAAITRCCNPCCASCFQPMSN